MAKLVLHRMQAFVHDKQSVWVQAACAALQANNWDYPQLGEGVCKHRHGVLSNQ